MTEPAPSGGTSPLRVGGLALLGVGAVAAIVGIGTLVSGGGDGSGTTAAPAPTTSAATPAEPGAGATTAPNSGAVGVPSFPATPTAAIAAPGTAGDGSGAGAAGAGTGTGAGSGGTGGGGGTVAKAPVRVYNNSTISGLAARAADEFRTDGWTVEAVANYPYGTIPTSTVYYRPGTSEQNAAEAMGKEFGMRVLPRFDGLDEATPGLIAIVTNDYQKR
jgi:LytR cell envelope-related transcriptional attenuator